MKRCTNRTRGHCSFTRWTLGMLQDQGAMSSRRLAEISGWPLSRAKRMLEHLQARGLVEPRLCGRSLGWGLTAEMQAREWSEL